MSYTTTTVSRRRFMVKAKKPGLSQSTPAPGRLDEADSSSSAGSGSSKASAPELFLRTSYRRPLRVAPPPWWKNWLAVTMVNAVVVAVVGGLYFLANDADSDEGSYVPRRATARPPSATNSRPVEASPAPRLALATARQGPSVRSGASADSATASEIDRAMLDGNRKVILPSNVAGNCSIGDGGSKDFGRCLAQNGARAQ